MDGMAPVIGDAPVDGAAPKMPVRAANADAMRVPGSPCGTGAAYVMPKMTNSTKNMMDFILNYIFFFN